MNVSDKGNDALPGKSVQAMEQLEAFTYDLAPVVATFYRELCKLGVATEHALELTKIYLSDLTAVWKRPFDE